MRILVVPDSFKGSLSATRVCEIVGEELQKVLPLCEILPIPVADGGEGTLDCFASFMGGKRISRTVTGPNFTPVQAEYLLCGDRAIIETAQAAGLPMANPKNPCITTTYGVGELCKDAQSRGAKQFIIGIGGSATNDCGCGFAAAMGAEFYDATGKKFVPVGETLEQVCRIVFPPKRQMTVLCDVTNPLCGKNGAAYVYAPQKGATPEQVRQLDKGMAHLANLLQKQYGADVANTAGAGAAGGMGAGLTAFFGATLKRGIDTVLDLAGFDEKAKNADVIITGEGALDSQSFCGKVPDGILKRSGNVPVFAVAGISKLTHEQAKSHGIAAVFESNPAHRPFAEILPQAEEDLRRCAALCAEKIRVTKQIRTTP